MFLWDNNRLLKRAGLSVRDDTPPEGSILLAGSTADPEGGQVMALTSKTDFDDNGNISEIGIAYWRHQPFANSLPQNLITIKTVPAKEGRNTFEIDQIWTQSDLIYDRQQHDLNNPHVLKKYNRALETVNRLNLLLREKGEVKDLAKIVADCHLETAAGNDITIRGLDKKGGFDFSLTPYFMKTGTNGSKKPLEFKSVTPELLKTIHGCWFNSIEPNKDFSLKPNKIGLGVSEAYSYDPKSGVEYSARTRWNVSGNKITMGISSLHGAAPEGIDPKTIPDVVKLQYEKAGDNYVLKKAVLLDRKVELDDIPTLLKTIGFAQECNRHMADGKYPPFMDLLAKYDLLEWTNPLHTPPSFEKGGEFLYGSLHGCGFEKKIENFGDQIGIAALFLHRGLKKDGMESTIGWAVDFPFASGGPDSNYDGAIPDYLPFWDNIKGFSITHDHYDHKGGLALYAAKGLMRDKIVTCTSQVKYMIDTDLNNLRVPRAMRPIFNVVDHEGAFPVEDEDGNVRMWVQHCPNATDHSALCTPYIVTGCYNDDHYKGSVLVYGDSRGLKEKSLNFFKEGTRALPEQAKVWDKKVTASKVDKDITVVLHDVTAVRNDGESPTQEEVEENLNIVAGWLDDKDLLMAPISTNNSEYTAGINMAHASERNITAVGRNAELRLSCMNLFGVMPDIDLRTLRIDPLEEFEKPESERLIPQDILDEYFDTILKAGPVPDGEDQDVLDEYLSNLSKLHEQNSRAFTERLQPDERDHETSVRHYILESLYKYGAIVFENDINGYLMCRAISDHKDTASIRATRTSTLAKGFRNKPGSLLIFATGTQGNGEEKFSTVQKLINSISLLDVDEEIRSTGYKIDTDNFVAIITQPAIVGNEASQENMVRDLVRARDMTVISAFLNGFTVHNPKGLKDKIVTDLKKRGWKYQIDAEGSIHVYDHPIHKHGHGFRQDLINIAKAVPAVLHEAHHIPDHDSYAIFCDIIREIKLNHSGIKPDDFKFLSIDAHQTEKAEQFKVVAHINPSYILVENIRPHGQHFGGFLQLTRATMLRREGQTRDDGLMVRSSNEDVYNRHMTAQVDWAKVSNPNTRVVDRDSRLGPSSVDRSSQQLGTRSRPRLDMPISAETMEIVKELMARRVA